MPPAPLPEASWCPSATGGNGMTSAMRVGRSAMLACIQRKSSSASWTPFASAMRPFDLVETACCIALKMFRDPGRASAIERSSPRAACQRLRLVRRWEEGKEFRISCRRAVLCGGSVIVMLIVSTIHPRTSFIVPHEQSPAASFLSNTGSRRSGPSPWESGRNTSSTAWSSRR